MGSAALKHDMIATRGSTFHFLIAIKDKNKVAVDLTGFEVRMQIRERIGMYGVTTASTLLFEASTGNAIASITEPTSGEIIVRMTSEAVTLLNPENMSRLQHGYGIELFKVNGAEEYVVPLLEGSFFVLGEVVR